MKKLFLLFLITNMTAATLTGQVMMMFSSDPASGITSPLDIDSLFYWYAADVGVTTDNNKVTQWNDLSGNGHHVTQADTSKAPTFEATGGPGSRPTLTFDGTNDFLASAAHFWGSDDLTVIVVVKFASATPAVANFVVSRVTTTTNRQWDFYLMDATNSNRIQFRNFSDGTVSNFVSYSSPTNSGHTTWKVHSSVRTGTSSNNLLFTDGLSVTVTRAATGTGNDAVYDNTGKLSLGVIFPDGTPTGPLNGSISEIIVYSRALTTAERSGLEQNYLCKKYGLACP